MSENRYSEPILEFLGQPAYRPVKPRVLAKLMQIEDEEYGEFRRAVKGLRDVGRIVLGGGSALTLPQAGRTLIGTYRANPRGFGFVVPESPDAHGDLFIPPNAGADAVTGDVVECAVERRPRPSGEMEMTGRVIRIVRRGHNQFVGELCHEAGRWFVRPDGNRLHVPIFVADVAAKGARAGDHVVVEMVSYPKAQQHAKGVIVERLGRLGQPGVELKAVIRQYDLPEEFPREAVAEARAVVQRFDVDREIARREDLRDEIILTIDPDDARDFDDAISLKRLGGGHGRPGRRGGTEDARSPAWELGVHIADVSAFVAAGGTLDEVARGRGNSIYFPRHVIPMLPETLSNGLCSLQEGEPRLCKSAFIQYDAGGRPMRTRFANTIIQSRKRLTYRQAQAVIDGQTGGVSPEIVGLLQDMDTLARAIRQRRLGAGMIVLDLPEVELQLDDEHRVLDAHPADDSFTHKIIEMFMVEANEAVARLFEHEGRPFIRRIHPDPDEGSAETLSKFLRIAGHKVPRSPSRHDLQRLLANLKGKPESHAVSLAVLKSLEQAVYSPQKEGHYALASDCYTHFTSPIRRYCDLTIHRTLDSVLSSRPGRADGKARRRQESEGEDLAALGRHLSFTERHAADAEREYKMLKVLQFLEQHVGESFQGVITGVTNFGLFVQHPRFLIDGLVQFENLPRDHWRVDPAAGCAVGERTRQRFSLGDIVTATIAGVDLAQRKLNLGLAGTPARRAAGGKSPDRRRERSAKRSTRKSRRDRHRR